MAIWTCTLPFIISACCSEVRSGRADAQLAGWTKRFRPPSFKTHLVCSHFSQRPGWNVFPPTLAIPICGLQQRQFKDYMAKPCSAKVSLLLSCQYTLKRAFKAGRHEERCKNIWLRPVWIHGIKPTSQQLQLFDQPKPPVKNISRCFLFLSVWSFQPLSDTIPLLFVPANCASRGLRPPEEIVFSSSDGKSATSFLAPLPI